jgi:hypothetical protein
VPVYGTYDVVSREVIERQETLTLPAEQHKCVSINCVRADRGRHSTLKAIKKACRFCIRNLGDGA